MSMNITNNWNNYATENTVKQKVDGAKSANSMKNEKTESTHSDNTHSNEEYLKKLQKQIPAMELKIGNGFAAASGKISHCITISPQLLEKMRNDPEIEKEQIQHLKDIERASKYVRSYYSSLGGEIVKQNDQWYIDENGNHSHYGEIRIDNKANKDSYKKSKEKEKRRIEKSRDKALQKIRQKKREFAKKLEEKRSEKLEHAKGEAQKAAEEMLDKKLSEAKEDTFYFYNTDFKMLLAADDEARSVAKEKSSDGITKAGAYVDIRA